MGCSKQHQGPVQRTMHSGKADHHFGDGRLIGVFDLRGLKVVQMDMVGPRVCTKGLQTYKFKRIM